MLLHVLVLAPFVAALLVALVGGRGTSAYRLSLFSAAVLTVASVALIAGGDVTTTAIDWFKLPGSDASVKYLLGSYTINASMANGLLPAGTYTFDAEGKIVF